MIEIQQKLSISGFDIVETFHEKHNNQINMSDLFKLEAIDSKGFGLVATKDVKRGTLILKEKAQI